MLESAIMSDAIDAANAAGPVCRMQTRIVEASAEIFHDRFAPVIHCDISSLVGCFHHQKLF